ncbi:MAG TPA: carbohydrate-binding family 9-like protein [Bryobacteraceae bacterium]|nr:carbohydrate-binding family 9-like protein [Bryobacteraceae bacterium]
MLPIAILLFAAAEAAYDVRPAPAQRAELLSGRDRAWTPAKTVTWGAKPYTTQFRALWNNSGLFVRFDVEDASPWHTMTRRDQQLWDEEVVEIFIDVEGQGRNYAEVEVNPANVVCDLRMVSGEPKKKGEIEWDFSGLQTRTFRNDTGWTALLFMPWSGFRALSPAAAAMKLPHEGGPPWRFNVFRIERPGGPSAPARDAVFAAWSPTGKASFHVPAAFRVMQFVR